MNGLICKVVQLEASVWVGDSDTYNLCMSCMSQGSIHGDSMMYLYAFDSIREADQGNKQYLLD